MRRFRVPLVLAVLAVVAACTAGDGGATAPTIRPPSPSTPSGTAAAEPDDAATGSAPSSSTDRLFAFEAQQVTGGTYDGSQLSGRDVAIWFWAPW